MKTCWTSIYSSPLSDDSEVIQEVYELSQGGQSLEYLKIDVTLH